LANCDNVRLQAATVAERGELLNAHFTYSLYVNVCRSLFERHKLLLSFIMAVKMQQHAGAVDPKEWRFLLAGPAAAAGGSSNSMPADGHGELANPAPGWLIDKAWSEVLGLSELPAFSGLAHHVANNLATYQALFDSSEVRWFGGRESTSS
jgi:dynein heavy chain